MENNLLLPEDLQTGGLLHFVIVEFLSSAYKKPLQQSLAKRYFLTVTIQFVWCFGFWLSVKYVNWLLGHFYTIQLWNEILYFLSDCVYTRESELVNKIWPAPWLERHCMSMTWLMSQL